MAAWLVDGARDGLIEASADAGFVVTRVYSEGRALADERSLSKALEPYYGRPILTVDLDELKQHVEGVSWVRSASVGRRLPDTLWIRLEEHRPIARWLDGARQVLVSDAGEVVRIRNAGRFRELPLLFGNGAPARAGELLRLVAREPDLAARVTGARLVGERRWDVHLDGRVEVRLPAERPEAAWRRLATEQRESAMLARAITAIDLRNPDWITVQIPDAVFEPGKGSGA
ncbi:MAG TPA: cell division protein FtsQ/DivIB [Geminicoccaceae bacterium]|nr:cell division protein FtsQ/DivIB [Geminicoccaceae bacterium]